MKTMTLDLSDVLSITTGRQVSLGGWRRIHEVIEFLMGGPVFSLSAARLSRPLSRVFGERFPALSDAETHIPRLKAMLRRDSSDRGMPTMALWLSKLTPIYGNQFEITPLTPEQIKWAWKEIGVDNDAGALGNEIGLISAVRGSSESIIVVEA